MAAVDTRSAYGFGVHLPREVAESPELRKVTRQLVGQVFYGTLLAQMRKSSLKTGLMSGGRAEQVFGAQLDSIFADHVALREKRGLGDMIYRRLMS